MRTAAAALLIVFAAIDVARAQGNWYDLYDQARQHVQRKEWTDAEQKLLQAQKSGPAPGRSVLRYGMRREPFFPDYYLGVVYLFTNRPSQALQKFQLARSQNLNVGDREFQPMSTYEGQARTDAQRLAENRPSNPLPTVPSDPGSAPVKPVVPDPGPGPSNPPVPDNKAEITRLNAQLDQAIRSRDLTKARTLLADLQKLATDKAQLQSYVDNVTALDRSIQVSAAERAAMRAFFGGDYQQTITVLSRIEQTLGTAALTGRGYFYRACGLAALAIRRGDTNGLAEARRQYGVAVKSAGAAVKQDRQFISPRVLQALDRR
jgi:hypothetical protein